jgi:hypothetical protein
VGVTAVFANEFREDRRDAQPAAVTISTMAAPNTLDRFKVRDLIM